MTRLGPSLCPSSADITKDRSASSSEENEPEPLGSDKTLVRKRKSKPRPKVANNDDSGSTQLEPVIALPRKQRPKRRRSTRPDILDSRASKTPVTYMTETRKVFLRRILDDLVEQNEEDSEPFSRPVDAVADGVPTYHAEIKHPMDLRTLRDNLGKEVYSSVEDFTADFRLIIDNSIQFNGLRHEVSQRGLRLQIAFHALMASLPGRK